MFMSILAGLIVSIDALFIGASLGLQKSCKFSYLVLINVFLFGLCFLGYFVAEQVYELIPIDPDYIVGFAFIGLGLFYILHYFIKERHREVALKKEGKGTLIMIGLVMSLEAMIITMGITLVFIPNATFLIPLTVALAHFAYSVITFLLVRTEKVRKIPAGLSHVLSGLGLIIYGLLALFVEIEI